MRICLECHGVNKIPDINLERDYCEVCGELRDCLQIKDGLVKIDPQTIKNRPPVPVYTFERSTSVDPSEDEDAPNIFDPARKVDKLNVFGGE